MLMLSLALALALLGATGNQVLVAITVETTHDHPIAILGVLPTAEPFARRVGPASFPFASQENLHIFLGPHESLSSPFTLAFTTAAFAFVEVSLDGPAKLPHRSSGEAAPPPLRHAVLHIDLCRGFGLW